MEPSADWLCGPSPPAAQRHPQQHRQQQPHQHQEQQRQQLRAQLPPEHPLESYDTGMADFQEGATLDGSWSAGLGQGPFTGAGAWTVNGGMAGAPGWLPEQAASHNAPRLPDAGSYFPASSPYQQASGMPAPGPSSHYAAYHHLHDQVADLGQPLPFADLQGKGSIPHAPRPALPFGMSPQDGLHPHGQSQREQGQPAAPGPTKPTFAYHSETPISAVHSSTRQYPSGVTGPSLKRGMACTFCRRRKLRCSADRPLCTNCIKFRKECEYEQGETVKEEGHSGGHARNVTEPDSLPSRPALRTTDSSNDNAAGSSASQTLQTPNDVAARSTFPQVMDWDGLLPQTGVAGPSTLPGTDVGMLMPDPHGLFSTGQPAPLLAAQNAPYDPSALITPYWPMPETPSYPLIPTAFYSAPLPHVSAADSADLLPAIRPAHASESSTPVIVSSETNWWQTLASTPAQAPSPYASTTQPQIPLPPRQPPLPLSRRASKDNPIPSSQRRTSYAAQDHPLPSRLFSDPADTPAPSGPNHGVLFPAVDGKFSADDPLDGLCERFGEFLFSARPDRILGDAPKKLESVPKRRKSSSRADAREGVHMELLQERAESDGLTNTARDHLLGIFLSHSRLFFEMSVPRFRYRMTFNDHRRPSLALLNAMYLWATHISSAPKVSPLTETFFQAAYHNFRLQSSRADRQIDGIRAAILLSIYASTGGRAQEGWLLAGLAMRMAMSAGLHQIPSCTFQPYPLPNPLLRQRMFNLPPPEDKLELAERITTFWGAYSVERCGSLVTGFPSAIRGEDILTPFPPPMAEMASGNVTLQDDETVRDLYRPMTTAKPGNSSKVSKWMKAVTILERAAKIALLDPAEDSEHARAWAAYTLAARSSPTPVPLPAASLEQPRYRCPAEFAAVQFAIERMQASMGPDGVFPVLRMQKEQAAGQEQPVIASHTIMIHFLLNTAVMFIHDINSMDCCNSEAISAARRCVALLRDMPEMPVADVDPFMVIVWGMIARTLVKEMHRLRLCGDLTGASKAEEDADVILGEMKRVGAHTILPRSQSIGIETLKNMDSRSFATPANTPASSRHTGSST